MLLPRLRMAVPNQMVSVNGPGLHEAAVLRATYDVIAAELIAAYVDLEQARAAKLDQRELSNYAVIFVQSMQKLIGMASASWGLQQNQQNDELDRSGPGAIITSAS